MVSGKFSNETKITCSEGRSYNLIFCEKRLTAENEPYNLIFHEKIQTAATFNAACFMCIIDIGNNSISHLMELAYV